MHKTLLALAALSASVSTLAVQPAAAQQMPDAEIAAAREEALANDDIAWDFVEGITTEIGPRMAGTEDEARGREWAMRWLKAQGFSNVRDEPFQMRTWVRGEEEAEIVAPYRQPMHVTALGNSASTGPQGMTGEVAVFPSRAALEAVPDGSLDGKIAYISHGMEPTQDGSGYGLAGPARWTGASLAEKKGASAIVIKSIGTDHHRNPHAGGTSFEEGQDAIPAGALSIPDAENLERMAQRAAAAGQPLMLKLTLTPRDMGMTTSGNVIAEIPGSDPDAGVALLACHLDSWDLATGAFDDGAGCGIIAAAAKRVAAMGQPRRTIRLLFAGAEEVGVFGGDAYGAAHKDEAHAFAMESDFGADRVWRVDTTRLGQPLADRLAALLAPMGVTRGTQPATGGADTGAIVEAVQPTVIDLQQDGTRYFDLHHTPDDTLDKIDPAQLRQNVAAWTATVALLANAPGALQAD
ncbi:M28 family peptidase [Croceicoccus marinus]|uniref:Carboxypeptidase Q n=1 Tax=Croceicoccus marinus TaxID=450378 RepID=A0A1Z1FCI4_9SPHN|nr:M28 family peptidase [Croceicoccus marinus]ARU16426.1 peptidase M28 family protein [Croceicoccus marinus]